MVHMLCIWSQAVVSHMLWETLPMYTIKILDT